MLEKLDLRLRVRDPIHGFVYFNEWERRFINHPWLQRLRRIKQLAFTDYVYPGANHNRFEHSLGVMHLATRIFVQIIQRHDLELRTQFEYLTKTKAKIWDQMILRHLQVLRFAALLHDVGHGPFSHAAEATYPFVAKGSRERYKHEDYSKAAINDLADLFSDNNGNKYWPGNPITATEVAGLLDEAQSREVAVGIPLQSLCRAIINSQLDADKLDYLIRDAYHCGVHYGRFDLERVIDGLTWCMASPMVKEKSQDEPTPEPTLALNMEDRHLGEQVVIARYWMYQYVYFHKTRRIFDMMYSHALPKLLPKSFPKPSNLGEYFQNDDIAITNQLLHNKTLSHLPLAAAITRREHPRQVMQVKTQELADVEKRLKTAGFSYSTDEHLASAQIDEKTVWIDTGRNIEYYKMKGKEIKLRLNKQLLDKRFPRRYPFDYLSKHSDLVKALSGGQEVYRVYCSEAEREGVRETLKEFVD